jgi:hypothetical protein
MVDGPNDKYAGCCSKVYLHFVAWEGVREDTKMSHSACPHKISQNARGKNYPNTFQVKDPQYPLGKPQQRPLASPLPPHLQKKKRKPESSSSGSFFDFLIPSFVRGAAAKSDREGPGPVLKKRIQQERKWTNFEQTCTR